MSEALAHLRALVDALPAEHPVTVPSAWLRELLDVAERPVEVAPAEVPELLTVEQAAARIGVSKDQVYRRAKRWPFARKIGKAVKIDAAELDAWARDRARSARPARG